MKYTLIFAFLVLFIAIQEINARSEQIVWSPWLCSTNYEYCQVLCAQYGVAGCENGYVWEGVPRCDCHRYRA